MKKVVKTFEEFIGDKQRKQQTWREDEVQLRPALNTNDPQRHYDDEYDGKDQIQDLVYARNTLWQQARDEWEDAYRAKSRLLITPVTSKNWLYFPIMKSKGSSTKNNYGGGRHYGESEYQYGVSVG